MLTFHQEVGRGAYGVVVDATKGEEKFVAKFFGYTDQAPDVNWILREIDNLYHLRGVSGVAQIHCTINDTPEGRIPNKGRYADKIFPVIVMEKLSGGDLFDRIVSNIKGEINYGEQEASQIFRSLIKTLQVIHDERNMINIDLKTENLVFRDANSYDIKIIDFGMAVHLEDREEFYGQIGRCDGTPRFLAYETKTNFQTKGQALYSRSTDMWQAACILYILLVANLPFQEEEDILKFKFTKPLDSLPLSPRAIDLLKTMFSPDPRNRLTAAEVLEHPWLTQTGELPTTSFGQEVHQDFVKMSEDRKVRKAFKGKHNRLAIIRSRVHQVLRKRTADALSQMEFYSAAPLGETEINVIKQIFRTAAEEYLLSSPNPSTAAAAASAATEESSLDEPITNDICLQVLRFGGIGMDEFRDQVRRSQCLSLQFLDNAELCQELDWDRDGKINYFECLFSLPFGYVDCNEPPEDYLSELYFKIFDIDNSPTETISLDVIKNGICIYLQDDEISKADIDGCVRERSFKENVAKGEFIDFIIECRTRGVSTTRNASLTSKRMKP